MTVYVYQALSECLGITRVYMDNLVTVNANGKSTVRSRYGRRRSQRNQNQEDAATERSGSLPDFRTHGVEQSGGVGQGEDGARLR